LVQWKPENWGHLIEKMFRLRDLLLRQDAKKKVLSLDQENGVLHEGRQHSPLYTKDLERLLRYLQINQALAVFRHPVEHQLHQDGDGSHEEPVIEPWQVDQFR